MKSDLFHDVARAYYGISPELYALSQKYAAKSMPGQTNLFDNPEGNAAETEEGKAAASPKKADAKKRSSKKTDSKTVNPNFPPPKKQPKSSPGQMNLPFGSEEPAEYGLKDVAKKAALGAGVALSAMGGGCSGPSCDSTPAVTIENPAQPALRAAKARIANMKAKQQFGSRVGVETSGGKAKWSPESESAARQAASEMQLPLDYSLDGGSDSVPPEAAMPYALGDARKDGCSNAVAYALPNAKAKSKRWKRPRGKKGKLPEKNCATACK